MPIGHYSHSKLVGIICEYVGKAHGTDGCFDLEEARSIIDAAANNEDPPQDSSITLAEAKSISLITGEGIQTIRSGEARIRNSPTLQLGALAVAEGAVLSIEEPYGMLEIM